MAGRMRTSRGLILNIFYMLVKCRFMFEGLDLHGGGPYFTNHTDFLKQNTLTERSALGPSIRGARSGHICRASAFFRDAKLEEVINQSRISAASAHKMGSLQIKN